MNQTKPKINLIILAFSFLIIILLIFQLLNSENKPLNYQSEISLINLRQRMNDYPPKYYRLAHIIEQRPESQLFYKLQDNFFAILDTRTLPAIIIPFIYLGLFRLVQKRQYYLLLITLILPITILTLLGPAQPSGYFSLYPFLVISISNGLVSILKK